MVSVSTQGWYLTLVLSLLSSNQSAVWFTFASVDPDIVTHHIPGMTKNMIRWSLLLGPIGYFAALPFTTALATYTNGIQKCIIVSNVCVVVAVSGFNGLCPGNGICRAVGDVWASYERLRRSDGPLSICTARRGVVFE